MPANSGLNADAVIGVVGAGTMGAGIAQVAASAGHRVRLFDVQAGAAARARAYIVKSLDNDALKGRIAVEAAQSIATHIEVAAALADLAGCALVIEAIVEKLEAKRSLIAQLETVVTADCLIASNTSSLSITALAAGARQPQRIVGMHFFNPVPRMRLVEIVSGLATDPALAERAHATAQAWGKRPVHARSTPGFIVNRVARPYYAEALRLLQEQAATPATLDRLLREGGGFRMGPFELMDLIGHDINYAVTCSVFEAYYQDPRYKPSLLQQELVEAGRLGRKSGRGFYEYGEGATISVSAPLLQASAAAPSSLNFHGDPGLSAALREKLQQAGWTIDVRDSESRYGLWSLGNKDLVLALSDGRSATQLAAETGQPNVVLCDWSADGAAPLTAIAAAAQCSAAAREAAVQWLSAAGLHCLAIADTPGLVVLRTVAMLANEAADAVHQGVARAQDVDLAMCDGLNYPRGPLEWAQAIGLAHIRRVLGNLYSHYEDDRYRCSPLIKQQVWANSRINNAAVPAGENP